MDKPRIYVDFNEMIDDDIVLLSQNDTKIDSAGNIITFYEGMPVSIYMDDVDCDGREDNLIAEGIAIKHDLNKYPWSKHVKWYCCFNRNSWMNESDLMNSKMSNKGISVFI